MRALDIQAVHAFVLTADLKSFTRAAEALGSTQSVISIKIRRLETELGRRLLERTPRQVRLSAEGSVFLEEARTLLVAHERALAAFAPRRRRLTLGMTQHIVGPALTTVLRRLADTASDTTIDFRIGSSHQLYNDFERGDIDAALLLGHENRSLAGETVGIETFRWMAAPDYTHRHDTPFQLATQPDPCSVRRMVVDALDDAGIAWTETFVGGGMSTIGAAVAAGLAIGALATRVIPSGVIDVEQRFGLPALPQRNIVLYSQRTDPSSRAILRTLNAAVRASA